MKKRLITLIVIILVIGLGCGLYFTLRKQANPNELTLYGNIEIRQVDLSFQVSGQILKMLKEEGDSVSSGELIAVLDDKDYKSNFEKSSAEVKRTQALKNDAASKYERNIPLCYDNIISKEECDTLTYNKDKTAADYEASVASEKFARSLHIQKFMHLSQVLSLLEFRNPAQLSIKGSLFIQCQKINRSGLEHMLTKKIWVTLNTEWE